MCRHLILHPKGEKGRTGLHLAAYLGASKLGFSQHRENVKYQISVKHATDPLLTRLQGMLLEYRCWIRQVVYGRRSLLY